MEKGNNQNEQGLVGLVKKDVESFLKNNHNLFFNERDFQMHLAIWLKETKKYDDIDVKYDDIDVEYYVPKSALDKKYVWNSELYIDIVVKKDQEYCLIELKYKTKEIASQKIDRFGESLGNETILKNQSAQNYGKYNFWKDVRRIELVTEKFKNVKGGLAIFLTNDQSYLKGKENSACSKFSMNDGVCHEKDKDWTNTKNHPNHPDFEVDKKYTTDWFMVKNEKTNSDFYYCILEITK